MRIRSRKAVALPACGLELGEVGAGWHCSQAPDEMQRLAEDLKALVEQSGLAAPAIKKLLEPDERDRSAS